MTSTLNALAAQEHIHDLERQARRAHKQDSEPDVSAASIELRLAYADESRVLHRLAQLDDAPDLDGDALLALIDGEAIAALSLSDRRVVANPFVRTEHAVSLLRIQADHLFGRRERRRLRGIPRLRLA
ncbi:MAG: hypothetical protein ACXVH1_40390 [Solirubrobacteraceae bacterium]